ncbi:MAG: hypothetical protein ACHREM_08700 [Polyangiales bacterium]
MSEALPLDDPKALAEMTARLHATNPEWQRLMRASAPRVQATFVRWMMAALRVAVVTRRARRARER